MNGGPRTYLKPETAGQVLLVFSSCSSARDSALRSVIGFRSESARERITARSLSVVEDPGSGEGFGPQFLNDLLFEGELAPV
jgi:hypothetical protein